MILLEAAVAAVIFHIRQYSLETNVIKKAVIHGTPRAIMRIITQNETSSYQPLCAFLKMFCE
jgi:hypothetical protein